MVSVSIRELLLTDENQFLSAMLESQSLHHPWVKVPLTPKEFKNYIIRSSQENQKNFLVCNENKAIVGVINISEIVSGCFQNAYLGFYGIAGYTCQGLMSAGLRLVLDQIFNQLQLHRVEANIQPNTFSSIQLVKKHGFRYEGFSPRYLKINNQWCGHERWAITFEDYTCDNKNNVANDYIEIVSYDSSWPQKAAQEIENIKIKLPSSCVIDIQHVGSTAIPDIAAKPIIDIQIATPDLNVMRLIAVPALQKLGYEYWAENPDPDRMFFAKGMPPFGEKRTHHVHIVELISNHWQDKIAFRDYLIAHPDIAKKYEKLKLLLANKFKIEREHYTNAKSDFVKKILQLVNIGK